jgi:rhamnosyltransferase
MRVLTVVMTFNDVAFIEQALEGLRRQIRPSDAIIIVDNASTDGTLDKDFSNSIIIHRNSENLGPSGAIGIAFAFALENGFDWTWVLDADSVPEPDALEKLLGFFDQLKTEQQEKVLFLSSWPMTEAGGVKEPPSTFEKGDLKVLPLSSFRESTQCDAVFWSGSMYSMKAVARIGPPSADYFLDYAEAELGYRGRRLGFTSYVVHSSVVRHDVGRPPGIHPRVYRFGPLKLSLLEMSPLRTYYAARNMIYFWLYECKPRHLKPVIRAIVTVFAITLTFVLRPLSHRRQLLASIRGIRDGLTGNMAARY